jgi:hypothetical protein
LHVRAARSFVVGTLLLTTYEQRSSPVQPPFWVIALSGFLIAARPTRFVNDDYLFAPVRDWVERKTHAGKLYYLLSCPWCASIWLAAPVAAIAVWGFSPYTAAANWWLFVALWFGYSWVYGLVSTNLDDE